MEVPSTFKMFGLTFSFVNLISATLAALIVFLVVFWLSRNLQLRPTKRQNVLEWMADFTNGIVKGSIKGSNAKAFSLFAFVLFFFIFISNQLGLFLQIAWNGETYIKSPTADPLITLTLALISLTLAHFAGVMKFGFKNYFVNTYFKPFVWWMPISLFEEFTNFLTLGLRIFGNIFAGEMLLKLIANFAIPHGIIMMICMAPLELIWQGFSVFLGSIQAFVFVTLTSVYISQKIQSE